MSRLSEMRESKWKSGKHMRTERINLSCVVSFDRFRGNRHMSAVRMLLFGDMTPRDGKGSAVGIAGKNKGDFWNGIKEKLTEMERLNRVSLLVMRL